MKPKEVDVDARVDDLVALLKANNARAIQFTKDVLKINEPDLKAWVEEDEQAAKDLLKSKISKF